MAVNGLAHTAQLRRILGWYDSPSCFSIKSVFFYGLAFILISPGIVHYNKAQQLTAESVTTRHNEPRRICESMDIRNSLESFAKLRNCEVIEGFLQILLFDSVNETELSKIQFPLLTEITDYLLLYRVNGLRSIGQLFPNLSVIRGQNTFLDNALVIFEMSTLQEIGLYSLTDITHGSVRIDKNPSLCFVHTIDWDHIVHDKTQKNFVKSLKPENECPICPSHVNGVKSENNSISVACPKAQRTNSDIFEKDKYLCWNRNHCQKTCPNHCNACNNKGQCCNKSCLACSDDNPQLCTVCPKYSIGFGRNKRCMQKCPDKLVGYLDRRCITSEECKIMPRPIELHATTDLERPYKVHKNSCILQCPPDHTDNYKEHTCDPCGGRCNKTCDGINIDSITVAKQLRGCTHIKGALEIQIRGGTNVTELEENLRMIEEISDYLKIVRSFSLVSLNFLKNLKRIRGVNLESKKFVFIVLDNQNLQELWDWTNRTLQIDRGSLYFHFNPKLCLDKIEKLRQIAGLPPFSELEVASNSNGDKTACNITPLKVNVTNITNKSVTLKWNPFHMDDQRKLLAYIIYIKEAPYRNVTLYDGRDACGQDDWRVVDVPNREDEQPINQPLPSLKPYTQYAFYVKTYTIASEKNGSQSEIQYFRTLPSMPSSPVNLNVFSTSSDSLRITWAPPSYPNGQITHYIVSGKKHQNGYMHTEDCQDLKKYMTPESELPKEEHRFTSTTLPPKKDTCQCDNNHKIRINIDEQEELARIKFEDKLHNEVYQKRSSKKKRSPPEFPKNANKAPPLTYNQIQNVTENGTNIWESFNFPVYGRNNFSISRLHHFTLYDINVQACRKIEGENDRESPCSSTSMQTHRTLSKLGAENIGDVKITNRSENTITISWEQPEDPNGIMFIYFVEYKLIDIENARPTSECVNAKDKNKTVQYTISKLFPGKYRLVVKAKSSGGIGFSPPIHFFISEPSSNTVLIVCVTLFVFLVVMVFLAWFYKKKYQKESENLTICVNPEYVPTVYIPDEWEVLRKQIELVKELGQGSFGMVWEGIAHDLNGKPEIRCAVKTVNEHATDRERLEFLNEASVMKAFDTAHVVRLLGVVSKGQPTLVIMELMANGDLKSYLRSHRPDVENYNPSLIKHPPSLKQILQMAIEIADGMAYLSAKKFVHRDLAARNCMVSEELTVKIGDFGMTRDIYETDYYRKGTKGLLPVRWMAPESLKDGLFASSSDVWSYGVVLWEMATLASQPYQGLSNDQVLRYVIDGGVMERPENCPDKLYTLMRYCWQHKPSARPTFMKLCQLLLEDASSTFSKVSFYHSPAGVEARALRPTPSPNQDEQTTPLRKVTEKLRGYTPSHSQESDELDIDTHHQFPSISESGVGVITTANGYVSGCPTNGAATTQC
uniref:Tyrosine-protein kinase receptor n=1 Tax=Colaphellus bowringi TaxID=561076 RepID=A0AA51QZB4_9CUCU|nr:insulin receptor [Colaphellus bowringi]